MWGLPRFIFPPRLCRRFIPTHVGVTVEYMVIRLIRAVHPHSCGGYLNDEEAMLNYDGSSPLAWGLPLTGQRLVEITRFIPTCVGVTRRDSRARGGSPVHPHLRGGYA